MDSEACFNVLLTAFCYLNEINFVSSLSVDKNAKGVGGK